MILEEEEFAKPWYEKISSGLLIPYHFNEKLNKNYNVGEGEWGVPFDYLKKKTVNWFRIDELFSLLSVLTDLFLAHKRIHCWSEGLQDIKAGEDNQGQEERIIIENGKCCRLIVSNFILLP